MDSLHSPPSPKSMLLLLLTGIAQEMEQEILRYSDLLQTVFKVIKRSYSYKD